MAFDEIGGTGMFRFKGKLHFIQFQKLMESACSTCLAKLVRQQYELHAILIKQRLNHCLNMLSDENDNCIYIDDWDNNMSYMMISPYRKHLLRKCCKDIDIGDMT